MRNDSVAKIFEHLSRALEKHTSEEYWTVLNSPVKLERPPPSTIEFAYPLLPTVPVPEITHALSLRQFTSDAVAQALPITPVELAVLAAMPLADIAANTTYLTPARLGSLPPPPTAVLPAPGVSEAGWQAALEEHAAVVKNSRCVELLEMGSLGQTLRSRLRGPAQRTATEIHETESALQLRRDESSASTGPQETICDMLAVACALQGAIASRVSADRALVRQCTQRADAGVAELGYRYGKKGKDQRSFGHRDRGMSCCNTL